MESQRLGASFHALGIAAATTADLSFFLDRIVGNAAAELIFADLGAAPALIGAQALLAINKFVAHTIVAGLAFALRDGENSFFRADSLAGSLIAAFFQFIELAVVANVDHIYILEADRANAGKFIVDCPGSLLGENFSTIFFRACQRAAHAAGALIGIEYNGVTRFIGGFCFSFSGSGRGRGFGGGCCCRCFWSRCLGENFTP